MIGKALIKGVLSYFFGDVNERLRRQQHEEMARLRKEQEGRITINYKPKYNKNIGKNEGDYVDFEEIK